MKPLLLALAVGMAGCADPNHIPEQKAEQVARGLGVKVEWICTDCTNPYKICRNARECEGR